MKSQKTLRAGKQLYEMYNDEDFEVWETLVERQLPALQKAASADYLRCLELLNFQNGKIPSFQKIRKTLLAGTAWQLHGVEEIVEIEPFLWLMTEKKFPATTWIRAKEQIDYLEEPDMFHDVFGHVPLLADERFAGFLQGLGDLGIQFLKYPQAQVMVQRMYWFTVEFGLIMEPDGLKAYGAGIISSPGELAHFQTDKPEIRPFGVKEIVSTDFRTDIIQPKYFVIDSLEQLYQSKEELQTILYNTFKARSA